MKQLLLITGIAIASIYNAAAQNPNLDYPFAVKVSNLTQYVALSGSRIVTSYYTIQRATKELVLFHPTIALQWKTKRTDFHEVELTELTVDKNAVTDTYNGTSGNGIVVSGTDVRTIKVAARYEYILNFNKSKERKTVPAVGFGVSPYLEHTHLTPLTSVEFPATDLFTGARAFVTPRLTYFVRPKWFIDFNVPVCVFSTFLEQHKSESPYIPQAQQSISKFDVAVFPRVFSGRIGIGLKI